MVTVWWNSTGVLHHEFMKTGESINTDTYCHQIDKMHQKLVRANPAVVNRKGPILLHDNARPHVSRKTLQKLNDLGYEILPHPAYSPDLSPTDYHIFKHLNNFIKGRVFKNQTLKLPSTTSLLLQGPPIGTREACRKGAAMLFE
ncbi:unnamed protein product, partial [Strongylus vulgaris]